MFGVRSLLVNEKVLLMKRDDLANVLFQRLIRRSQQYCFSDCIVGYFLDGFILSVLGLGILASD